MLRWEMLCSHNTNEDIDSQIEGIFFSQLFSFLSLQRHASRQCINGRNPRGNYFSSAVHGSNTNEKGVSGYLSVFWFSKQQSVKLPWQQSECSGWGKRNVPWWSGRKLQKESIQWVSTYGRMSKQVTRAKQNRPFKGLPTKALCIIEKERGIPALKGKPFYFHQTTTWTHLSCQTLKCWFFFPPTDLIHVFIPGMWWAFIFI